MVEFYLKPFLILVTFNNPIPSFFDKFLLSHNVHFDKITLSLYLPLPPLSFYILHFFYTLRNTITLFYIQFKFFNISLICSLSIVL